MKLALRILFAVAALVGVAGIAANFSDADWMGVVLSAGLALLYGSLAVKPEILAHTWPAATNDPATLAAQLAVVLLLVYLVLTII